ncbi:MAG: hypothetical protein HUU20_03315 [Pirellulales bacterium]|nr:hypothetical protein [Pirellulales bacterium]
MSNLEKICRAAGIVVQIIVMGELLLLAIGTMYAIQTNTQVFRYAGF